MILGLGTCAGCRSALRLAAILLLAASTPLLRAEVVYESAVSGPTGQNGGGGLGISNTFIMVVNFEVTQPVMTGRVGAHLLELGNGEAIFAAIISIDNELDFVQPEDLTGDTLVGVTTIDPPALSDNVSGNLAVILQPGWYALALGTGSFGTTGDALLLGNNNLIDSPLIYGVRLSDGKIIPQASAVRFFIDTLPVPAFEKVVDTDMLVPGSEFNFTFFSAANVRDGFVVFEASAPIESGVHENGVYRWHDGELVTLANLGTPIPDSDDTFRSFTSPPSTSRGETVFAGVGFEERRGIYVADGKSIRRVADDQTNVPDQERTFDQFAGWSTIHEGNVAFTGVDDVGLGYVMAEIDGELRIIAQDAGFDPDGMGLVNFILIGLVSIDGEFVSFRGVRAEPLLLGLFKGNGTEIQTLIDSNDSIPGSNTMLFYTGHGLLRDGGVAYGAGDDIMSPTDQAIIVDKGDDPQRKVDLETTAPDGDGTFINFFDPSFDGRHFSFLGIDQGGSDTRAIFTDLPGAFTRAVGVGTMIDGKTVSGVGINLEGLDGYDIVTNISFEDETRAIYLLRYPAFPGDVNRDRDLDLRDVALMQNCFDEPAEGECRAGDVNGDGVVAQADLFPFTCLGGPGAEPACLQ